MLVIRPDGGQVFNGQHTSLGVLTHDGSFFFVVVDQFLSLVSAAYRFLGASPISENPCGVGMLSFPRIVCGGNIPRSTYTPAGSLFPPCDASLRVRTCGWKGVYTPSSCSKKAALTPPPTCALSHPAGPTKRLARYRGTDRGGSRVALHEDRRQRKWRH